MKRASLTEYCRHVLSGYVTWEDACRNCSPEQRQELLRGQLSLGAELANVIHIRNPPEASIPRDAKAIDRSRKSLIRHPTWNFRSSLPRRRTPRELSTDLLHACREARAAYAAHDLPETLRITSKATAIEESANTP